MSIRNEMSSFVAHKIKQGRSLAVILRQLNASFEQVVWAAGNTIYAAIKMKNEDGQIVERKLPIFTVKSEF